MLDNKDLESTWIEMKNFIRKNARGISDICGIGTGGNINKLYRLSETRDGAFISYSRLKATYHNLRAYSLRDSIKVIGLNPDRERAEKRSVGKKGERSVNTGV